MKLRLAKQSLRFRLSPADIEALKAQQSIKEELPISSSLTWSYELRTASFVNETQLKTDHNSVQILLPENDFLSWLQSEEIEWEYGQTSPLLQISIEKDLKPHRK